MKEFTTDGAKLEKKLEEVLNYPRVQEELLNSEGHKDNSSVEHELMNFAKNETKKTDMYKVELKQGRFDIYNETAHSRVFFE
ncbi:hypothetical protein [Fructilactobacillus sanfranciscensis]|uniref:Uncharacterized protein n=1 Tax=Fructilactobacillus sanfranciscensis (strain TMW 1.1304) TaxID=714313 RepID=G2KW42_FRUST|nr:hypothetical protein [Fructilactobacillus sanfranciscensis]AEN99018.1 hypothetical protein LSA_05930 [Fructilactobacillus sanfranciscensis TMW 1.1304]NDR60890.1 hypothetical protein [Fructilactobacillus sanfranciscensis]NDR69470.1 hypothetical protein [Fructilactobacillus sanfranciscensis]NDR75539.1 hypothetical protein [Fructilactobacillus sanfranciscensis]NDR96296.1 hypothetical protein [Fructilactobacillus sanfranciscensis]